MPEPVLKAYPQIETMVASAEALPGATEEAGLAEQDRDRKRGPLASLWRWVMDQVVGEVPQDSALCEFDCRKAQCSMGEWATCKRRLQGAKGELWPAAEDGGTKASSSTSSSGPASREQ